MATIVFSAKLSPEGLLTVPLEAVDALGLKPGDEVRVQLESYKEQLTQEEFDKVFLELLAEAQALQPEPPVTYNDPHEKAFAEAVREKFRKQGFNL